MNETYSYTYFSVTSRGEIGKNGLESKEAGIFDPDEITELLGIEPFRKWKKGDLRQNGTSYNFSAWNAEKSVVDRHLTENQYMENIKNLKTKIPI